MSKTFVLKRNPSQDGSNPHRIPEGRWPSPPRAKSLSREGSTVYNSPYYNTEFPMDGIMRRCPAHDVPRNSPMFVPKHTIERHHHNFGEWTAVAKSHTRHPSPSVHQGESSGLSSPRTRRGSPTSRHKDLKRKMVFDLHKEIKKPIHTTPLEEISDMDRITEICMTTLKSMMESKKHRRFLHHMNNNNVCAGPEHWPGLRAVCVNKSNNADKRKQTAGKLVGQIYLMSKRKQQSAASSAKYDARNRGKGTHRSPAYSASDTMFSVDEEDSDSLGEKEKAGKSKFRQVDETPEDFVHTGGTVPKKAPIENTPRKSRVGSVFTSAKASEQLQHLQQQHPEEGQLQKAANSSRDAALKLLADISAKIEQQNLEEEVSEGKRFGIAKKKTVMPITPEEALMCSWLRLSKDQVETLEQLVRDEGKIPEVHPHSDLTNYDVFEEIRNIRKQEQQERLRLKQLEEERLVSDQAGTVEATPKEHSGDEEEDSS